MPARASRSKLLASFPLLVSAVAFAAGPPPAVDRAARTEEVRQAELAFAASVMENRPERFAAMVDEAAVFVDASGATRGKAKIVEAWSAFFSEGRPYFEWHPEIVELSGDGELGLSRGPWTMRGKGSDGKEVERSGTFNSVWRRQPDGSWKIVFDAGCPPCSCANGGG